MVYSSAFLLFSDFLFYRLFSNWYMIICFKIWWLPVNLSPHATLFPYIFDVTSRVCRQIWGHEDSLLFTSQMFSSFNPHLGWSILSYCLYKEWRTIITSFFCMQKYNHSSITWLNHSSHHWVDLALTLKVNWKQILLYL